MPAKKTTLTTITIIIIPTTIVALIALLNGFNDWNALVYAVPEGLSGQTLQVPNEQTMNDVRGSRLVLLEGIDNAIQRLIDSQPKTSIQKSTEEGLDTTHIAQLLKTDRLGPAIEELTNLEAKVIKVFGEKAADKVVPQIENLIGALQKQEFSPPPSPPPSASE